MRTLVALVAVVAACVLARPPGPLAEPTGPPDAARGQPEEHPDEQPVAAPRQGASEEYFVPYFYNPDDDLYNDGEVNMEDMYRGLLARLASMSGNPEQQTNMHRPGQRMPLRLYLENYHEHTEKFDHDSGSNEKGETLKATDTLHKQAFVEHTVHEPIISITGIKNIFAFTPFDSGFYDKDDDQYESEYDYEQEDPDAVIDPRQIRQNPNLSRNKALVASNLDQLRHGLANKQYRMPVSLLPANLNWLKIVHPIEEQKSTDASGSSEGTTKPGLVHYYESGPVAAESAQSVYGIALVAAVGAALAMAIVGFAFGWYSLAKRAKAAADVDYPAYGVTGPTADLAGDRKLAHSAHMYHYQHQKQQILAMERNCVDQSGSVSDPESEEENEEGDYTVYECPGFATTGEMEVKNPLFTDENAPATPGKCELVKPQPKE